MNLKYRKIILDVYFVYKLNMMPVIEKLLPFYIKEEYVQSTRLKNNLPN